MFTFLWYNQQNIVNNRVDGGVDKFCASLFPWPPQNYNQTKEQSSLRIAWNLAEQKSYN